MPRGNGMPTQTPYRRGLTRIWKCRTEIPCEGRPLLERILAARGLDGAATAGAFLDPSLRLLPDPSLIPDLDRAARRLLDAALARELIVIYGDYDVDGVSATAILFHALRAIAPEAPIRTYVPHRLDEGYGLNSAAVSQLSA